MSNVKQFLKQLEERNLKLDELWDLREEQRSKNRKLSTEFTQFERDTREVRKLVVSKILNCQLYHGLCRPMTTLLFLERILY